MFDRHNPDRVLRRLPNPTPRSGFPGDPGLGSGLRYLPIGRLRLPEPDTLVVVEPGERDPGALPAAVRVERCAAGTWDVHVARLWIDKYRRTATYEIRFALTSEPPPVAVWAWPDRDWDPDPGEGVPAGEGTSDGVTGEFSEDGGTMVALFERESLRLGSDPSWQDTREGLLDRSTSNAFPPYLLTPDTGFAACGVSPGTADVADGRARARRRADGHAVEVRVAVHPAPDLSEFLADLDAEAGRVRARIAELEDGGGYPASTGTCRKCELPGTVRVPVLTLLRLVRNDDEPVSMRDLLGFLPEPELYQIMTGTHPACR